MIKLFQHQEKILNLSKDKTNWAWLHETGTGKTIIACENIKYLYQQKKIKAVIITAPKTVVEPVWVKTLFGYYLDIKFRVFEWVGSLSLSEERVFKEVVNKPKQVDRLIIFLVNVDAFSYGKILYYVKDLMTKFPTLWIIDESTTIKTPNAKRTKSIIAASHLAQYKRILSGFPILRSPEDLYSQIAFLSPNLTGHKSFYSFRNYYCITKQLDNRVTISIGPKNTEQLQATLEEFSSRIMKKDCLDLPDKIRTVRYVPMTKEQLDKYYQMKTEGYITLKNTNKAVFAANLLVQLEKLHQIANGLLANPLTYFDCNKYSVLLDIIQNEIADKQFIIWASYVGCIKQIHELLDKCKITHGLIYGETNVHERNKVINSFIKGDIQCIVANPSTAMHGLTLVQATYAIYFSNSFHLEHRIQSEDRLHRIGQVNKVTYIDLITEKTIENKVLDTLESKHNIGAQALGDEWVSWFN